MHKFVVEGKVQCEPNSTTVFTKIATTKLKNEG